MAEAKSEWDGHPIWNALSVETMDMIYFIDANGHGDFYQCILPTEPGQSPTTNPECWSRVQIPKMWRKALVRLTYSNLLEMDGQTDKADTQKAIGMEDEHNGVEVMIRNEANRDSWRTRPKVQTPIDPLARSNIFWRGDRVDTAVQT